MVTGNKSRLVESIVTGFIDWLYRGRLGETYLLAACFNLRRHVFHIRATQYEIASQGEWKTRQLPMGAGHCRWSGYTDRNVCVAVSCGYDTWFAVRLVMDYTTSHFTWSNLDTLVPSISCLWVYMGCALAFVLQVRSLYVPCYMVHFQGSISGSP